MIRISRKLGKFAIPLYWMVFGCSVGVGVNGLLESRFENEILENVAKKAVEKARGRSEDDLIDTAVFLCNYLQERRSEILGGGTYRTFKATYFKSSLQSFYIGTGACGYYSLFTARVFQKLGYRPKIVQQRVNGQWGAHITVIVPMKKDGRFVLLDPLFKYTFRDAQNHHSTLAQVQKNWASYYSKHTPAKYNPNYDYQEGWRHTNWDKYGIFSRAVHHLLEWIQGPARANFWSLRMWIIDAYLIQAIVSFVISGFCLLLLWVTYRKGCC